MAWKYWDRKKMDGGESLNIILSKKMVLQFEEDITGFAMMTIDRRYIDKICSQNINEDNMKIIITDEQGTIISHPDESKVLSQMDQNIMNQISDMEQIDGSDERFFNIKIDGEELLVSYDILSRKQMAGNKYHTIFILDAEHNKKCANCLFGSYSTDFVLNMGSFIRNKEHINACKASYYCNGRSRMGQSRS